MNQLLQSYLTEIAATRSSKTHKDYLGRLERFDRSLTERQITELNRHVMIEFLTSLKGVLGSASVHYYQQTLKSFCSWLVKNGKADRNWLQGEQISPYKSVKRPDSFAFNQKEYRALVDACLDEEWRSMIVLGWHTALRMGDLANLEWTEIGERKIVVTPQKTQRFSKTLEIPIGDEVIAQMAKLKPESTYCLPRLQAQYARSHTALSHAFKRICERAKVKDKSFHGLRHSWVTRALSKGVPIGIVSSITGQSIQVIQRYLHPTFDDKTKALEVMK